MIDKLPIFWYNIYTMQKVLLFTIFAVIFTIGLTGVFQPVFAYNSGYYGGYYSTSPIDSLPVWGQLPAQATRVGQPIKFSVNAYDPDGDYIVYDTVYMPAGASFNGYTRVFTWTPTTVQIGVYTVVFRARADGVSVDMSVPITVYDFYGYAYPGVGYASGQAAVGASSCGFVPGPVAIGFNPSLVAVEGELYFSIIQAASGNNNQVSYVLIEGPDGMRIDERTGRITWTPAFNQGRSQPYFVRFGMYNGQCQTNQSFYVTVEERAPVQASVVAPAYAAPAYVAPAQPAVYSIPLSTPVVECGCPSYVSSLAYGALPGLPNTGGGGLPSAFNLFILFFIIALLTILLVRARRRINQSPVVI